MLHTYSVFLSPTSQPVCSVQWLEGKQGACSTEVVGNSGTEYCNSFRQRMPAEPRRVVHKQEKDRPVDGIGTLIYSSIHNNNILHW